SPWPSKSPSARGWAADRRPRRWSWSRRRPPMPARPAGRTAGAPRRRKAWLTSWVLLPRLPATLRPLSPRPIGHTPDLAGRARPICRGGTVPGHDDPHARAGRTHAARPLLAGPAAGDDDRPRRHRGLPDA